MYFGVISHDCFFEFIYGSGVLYITYKKVGDITDAGKLDKVIDGILKIEGHSYGAQHLCCEERDHPVNTVATVYAYMSSLVYSVSK